MHANERAVLEVSFRRRNGIVKRHHSGHKTMSIKRRIDRDRRYMERKLLRSVWKQVTSRRVLRTEMYTRRSFIPVQFLSSSWSTRSIRNAKIAFHSPLTSRFLPNVCQLEFRDESFPLNNSSR